MQRLQATRRFDTHREPGNTINPLAKVCTKLPESCYDSSFLSQYGEVQQVTLGMKSNSSHLDDAVASISALLPPSQDS
jgi:hypothetical protein